MRIITIKECSNFITHKHFGFLYCFEVGNGNIKIGQTNDIKNRIHTHHKKLVSIGVDIKEILISKPHVNFIDTEVELFNLLKAYRVSDSEVFNCDIDVVKTAFSTLNYDEDIESKDILLKEEARVGKHQAHLLFAAFNKAMVKVRKIEEFNSKKGYAHGEEAEMINVIVFGEDNQRYGDYVTEDQIDDIRWLSIKNSAYIDIGMSSDKRKEVLVSLYAKRNQKKVT